ncbi:T-box transcription factor TBX21 [Lates japonicus]|uniref:T-box transcription factor TBX21 n=1 Tax=Lates japonicus TaxID=270547 RepID=A0AAD3MUQ4_LATJO|nr:T-box transcription factor TBX21 [Lates japonicus]
MTYAQTGAEQMGSIGGNLYLSMLNGAETQTFGKNTDISSHLPQSMRSTEFKWDSGRGYYSDSNPAGRTLWLCARSGRRWEGAGAARQVYAQTLPALPVRRRAVAAGSGAGRVIATADGFPGGKDVAPVSGGCRRAFSTVTSSRLSIATWAGWAGRLGLCSITITMGQVPQVPNRMIITKQEVN